REMGGPGALGEARPGGDAAEQPQMARTDVSAQAKEHLDLAKDRLDAEDLDGAAQHIRQASAVVKAEMTRANASEKPALEDAAAELERIAADAESGREVDEAKAEETFERAARAVEESENARS
ncbi:MAG: hypothetical protein K8I02_00145, partial [Candidatus Methylomirabilis sp.]|nr:hypothetical protein [Deltaproteobacteria bacterium]